jgi:hypothetical protein
MQKDFFDGIGLGPHVRFRRVRTLVREGQSVGQAAQFCLEHHQRQFHHDGDEGNESQRFGVVHQPHRKPPAGSAKLVGKKLFPDNPFQIKALAALHP